MKGELYFNGKDAYTNYGVIMGMGCYASLVCPPPAKSYITNDVRGANGREYYTDAVALDERTFSLTVYINASSYSDLYSKLNKLSNEVFSLGQFTIKTKYQKNVVYHVVYKGCNQLTELNGRLARFQIELVEPNPSYRSASSTYSGAMATLATDLATE